MCAFGINELRQHTAEILLLGCHAKQHDLGAHVSIESLDISDGETQFDLPRWILVGSRVESECRFARGKFTPARRFELHFQTEHIAVELHGFVHVGDKLNDVPRLCSLHLPLKFMSIFTMWLSRPAAIPRGFVFPDKSSLCGTRSPSDPRLSAIAAAHSESRL